MVDDSQDPLKLYCPNCEDFVEVELFINRTTVIGHTSPGIVAGCTECSDDVRYFTELQVVGMVREALLRRQEALIEMVRISEELGLYDDSLTVSERRDDL